MSTKLAVITGAANGFGRALAIALGQQGFSLALIDTNPEGCERTALELPGRTVTVHPLDVTNAQAVHVACAEIAAHHGRVDMLINNAGVSMSVPFEIARLEDMQRVFAVNYWGTVHMTQALLPHLAVQQGSHLVNIISGFAQLGFPGKTAYAASKAAIMGFSNALRTELIDRDILVSLVIPPPMATDIINGPHLSDAKREAERRWLHRHGMDLTTAAERTVKRVLKGDTRIVIGTRMFWSEMAARMLPGMTQRWVARHKGTFDFL